MSPRAHTVIFSYKPLKRKIQTPKHLLLIIKMPDPIIGQHQPLPPILRNNFSIHFSREQMPMMHQSTQLKANTLVCSVGTRIPFFVNTQRASTCDEPSFPITGNRDSVETCWVGELHRGEASDGILSEGRGVKELDTSVRETVGDILGVIVMNVDGKSDNAGGFT